MVPAETTRTLAVDIGGSGIKAIVLDEVGNPLTERARVTTPRPAKPEPMVTAIVQLAASQGMFTRVSVGCPGVVRDGVIKMVTPNLDSEWMGFDLATVLHEKLAKPVRVANDADVQGWGAVTRHGLELVITLGTGFGSALFMDGKLIPNLELAHHEFHKGKTYEEQLGQTALARVGKKRWNHRLEKAIASLQRLFNYDFLYIGGGNATKITLELPSHIKVVPNMMGLLGGIALWQD